MVAPPPEDAAAPAETAEREPVPEGMKPHVHKASDSRTDDGTAEARLDDRRMEHVYRVNNALSMIFMFGGFST